MSKSKKFNNIIVNDQRFPAPDFMKTMIMCLIFTLCIVTYGYAQPFHLAGDQDEAPFGFINEKNEFVGIFVEVMAEAFKRLGIELNHSPYPWKRAQKLVEMGKADGMITVITEERKKITVPVEFPVTTLKWVAFFRNDHPQREHFMNAKILNDFKNFKLLDYIGDGWGEANLKNFQVDRSGNFSQALLKLAGQRGDVFIQLDITTQYTLSRLIKSQELSSKIESAPLDKIIYSTNSLDTTKFQLLVSKNSPYVNKIELIDKTFQQMQDDGTLQLINDKYIKNYK